MAKTKWRCREYTPKGNMTGIHGFYAEAVISNEIDNIDLSAKIAARTGFKLYEAQAMVSAIADIVAEEVLESNRITLCDSKGTKMVSIYPKVSGSIFDDEVLEKTTAAHAIDPKVTIRNVAEESDLTADRLTWTLGATIGIKFSKTFAFNKQAQKVGYVATDTVIPNDEEPGTGTASPDPSQGGGNSGDGTNTGDNTGGNTGGGTGTIDTGGNDGGD